MIAALLLFTAASQMLVDEVYQIPPGEWRWVEVILKQVPVTVECDDEVVSGTGAVRVALVNHEGLDELRAGHHEPMGSSPFQRQGHLIRPVRVPDEYAVVIENSGRGKSSVRLRVVLDFSSGGQARYISPQRRLAVILISATVFLAIVIYSARKLRFAIR
jgi:hypothetical protein